MFQTQRLHWSNSQSLAQYEESPMKTTTTHLEIFVFERLCCIKAVIQLIICTTPLTTTRKSLVSDVYLTCHLHVREILIFTTGLAFLMLILGRGRYKADDPPLSSAPCANCMKSFLISPGTWKLLIAKPQLSFNTNMRGFSFVLFYESTSLAVMVYSPIISSDFVIVYRTFQPLKGALLSTVSSRTGAKKICIMLSVNSSTNLEEKLTTNHPRKIPCVVPANLPIVIIMSSRTWWRLIISLLALISASSLKFQWTSFSPMLEPSRSLSHSHAQFPSFVVVSFGKFVSKPS